jgi:hypothetical protein
MYLKTFWRRIASAAQLLWPPRRYTHALASETARQREEIAALRAENRALLNSILGISGIPPIFVSSAVPPRSDLAAVSGPDSPSSGPVPPSRPVMLESHAAPHERRAFPRHAKTNPLFRRRSWQQVTRRLEFESAKKNAASGE